MWFLEQITSFVAEVVYWLADARDEVQGWIWPFHYLATPLDFIARQVAFIGFRLVDFNEWLDSANLSISNILSFDDISSFFSGVFNAANAAWNWVWNAVSNVLDIIGDWWSGTWADVQSWVNSAIDVGGDVIDTIYGWINTVKDAILELIGRLPSIDEITTWFSDWWGNILSRIQDLGYLPASVIGDLINGNLSDWFPFYETLVDLINNPLDWLMGRVEYWFFDRRS